MAKRIGEILVDQGLVTQEQLEHALKEQKSSGKFLGEIFISLGYTTEEDLLIVLAHQFNTKYVQLENVKVNPEVIKLVPRALVWQYHFLPIEMRSAVILIAVSNPLDMWPLSALKERLQLSEVQIVLAKKEDIKNALYDHYGPDTGAGHE